MRKNNINCVFLTPRKVLITFALQLCIACAFDARGASLTEESYKPVERGVIVDKSVTAGLAQKYQLLELGSMYWTPDQTDIQLVEDELSPYLKNVSGKLGAKISAKLPDYKRQYLGYSSSDGARWILINAFCGRYWKKDHRWESKFVMVFDGGDCFFQVRYNVANHQFDKLEVNGES